MKRNNRLSSTTIAILVLVTGGLISGVLLMTSPETQPQEKERKAKTVQTIDVRPGPVEISITAYGPVIPSKRVVMRPEVRGRVVRLHEGLVPGGYLGEGEELIGIDPSDFELDLIRQEAGLEQAKFDLEVEKGRQVVASREWDLLSGDLNDDQVNRSLVLREPHLRRTEAMVKNAENSISIAKLNLQRTSVRAPFNAMVLSESVDIGQLVETGSEIAVLVGTDEFWVRASVSLEELKHIEFPEQGRKGSTVVVTLNTSQGTDLEWEGTVFKMLSDLEPTGRMARVLISVKDPMGLGNPSKPIPLLIGSYVQARIHAGQIDDAIAVPRIALREGNRIWTVDEKDELQIRDARVLWAEKEQLLLENNLPPGELIVVSDLKAPLPGLKVRKQPATIADRSL